MNITNCVIHRCFIKSARPPWPELFPMPRSIVGAMAKMWSSTVVTFIPETFKAQFTLAGDTVNGQSGRQLAAIFSASSAIPPNMKWGVVIGIMWRWMGGGSSLQLSAGAVAPRRSSSIVVNVASPGVGAIGGRCSNHGLTAGLRRIDDVSRVVLGHLPKVSRRRREKPPAKTA